MSLFTLFSRSRRQWLAGAPERTPAFVDGGLAALAEAEDLFLATPIASVKAQLDQTQHELEDVSYELSEARKTLRDRDSENKGLRQQLGDVTKLQSQLDKAKARIAELEGAPKPPKPTKEVPVPPLTDEQLMSPTRTNPRTPMEINQRANLRQFKALLDQTPLEERLTGKVHGELERLLVEADRLDMEALRTHPERPVKDLAFRVTYLQRALLALREAPEATARA